MTATRTMMVTEEALASFSHFYDDDDRKPLLSWKDIVTASLAAGATATLSGSTSDSDSEDENSNSNSMEIVPGGDDDDDDGGTSDGSYMLVQHSSDTDAAEQMAMTGLPTVNDDNNNNKIESEYESFANAELLSLGVVLSQKETELRREWCDIWNALSMVASDTVALSRMDESCMLCPLTVVKRMKENSIVDQERRYFKSDCNMSNVASYYTRFRDRHARGGGAKYGPTAESMSIGAAELTNSTSTMSTSRENSPDNGGGGGCCLASSAHPYSSCLLSPAGIHHYPVWATSTLYGVDNGDFYVRASSTDALNVLEGTFPEKFKAFYMTYV
jgi:hypothetical protein